jgi:hypothetical protein
MAMNRLKVDLPGLVAAFEVASWETSYCADCLRQAADLLNGRSS